MINIEIHGEQLLQGLALHRFNIHKEEIKRVIGPILNEVYKYGYERGIADRSNHIKLETGESKCDILLPEAQELSENI